MVQLGDVIEIESSPEPLQPRLRQREKGKGKATQIVSSVIELTDSEDDDDDKPHTLPQNRVVPSTPRPHTDASMNSENNVLTSTSPSELGAAASDSGTEAGPSKEKTFNQPLFLPDDIGQDPTTTHIERVQVDALMNIEGEPTNSIPIPLPPAQIPIQVDPLPPIPPHQASTPNLDAIPVTDPTSTAVAQILEIIPDIEPTHLLDMIEQHLPTFSIFHGDDAESEGTPAREATKEEQVQGVVGHVLHLLFENMDYPKANLRAGAKGKGKRVGTPDNEDVVGEEGKGKEKQVPSKKTKIDYASIDRPYPGGQYYFELALYHLQSSFPHIPKPYIRRQLQSHSSLYAPTHFSILEVEKSLAEKRPYAPKFARAKLRKPQGDDPPFEEEKAWLDAELAGGGNEKEVDANGEEVKEGEDVAIDNVNDAEDGIECQCCFADYPFSKMVQCPEAHLFCSTCISTYASTQLGAHNSSLTCIHSSSCPLPFPASELKRILPDKLYSLYERMEQQKQIMEAGLDGLEECPFCEWKCVLEVSTEEDKLFRCGNEEGGCGVVSCRSCKKLDHLPKSCKEVEEDKHLDGRHAIEEAMTRALMRNCPKCQKAFIKEMGCNKMSCPNCRTLSCYVCRQVIKGYDHFSNQQPGRATTSANANKCMLWDAVEERHAQEVKEAAEKAMEEYKRHHPDVDESAIQVDLPDNPAKVPGPGGIVNPPAYPGAMAYPNLNPVVGQAHVYPHMQPPVLPPPAPPPRAHRHHQQQPQPVANLHRVNTRAHAALVEQQRQAQQKQQEKAITKIKVERARMAEQVRLAEEENPARAKQRLDRVREQRDVARMDQQERARMALELERQRQGERLKGRQQQQQPQLQRPQVQVQVQLQGQVQQQPLYHHHHHHVYHHQQPVQPQPLQFPAVQNPFALAYPGGMQQQQQPPPQQVMFPPPQAPPNPYLRGGAARRR